MASLPDQEWKSKLVRDCDCIGPCLDRIGAMLCSSAGQGYEVLAGEMGYSQQDVESFRLNKNPGRAFLEDWMTGPGTTVRVLLAHLKRLGRDDVVKALEKNLRDPKCMIILVIDDKERTPMVSMRSTVGEVLNDLKMCHTDEELFLHVHNKELKYQGDFTPPSGDIFTTTAQQCMGMEVKFKAVKPERPVTVGSSMPTVPTRQKTGQAARGPEATSVDTGVQKRLACYVSQESSPLVISARDSENLTQEYQEISIDLNGPEVNVNSSHRTIDQAGTSPLQSDSYEFPSGSSPNSNPRTFGQLELQSRTGEYSQVCVRQIPGYHREAINDYEIARLLSMYSTQPGVYILRPSRQSPNMSQQ